MTVFRTGRTLVFATLGACAMAVSACATEEGYRQHMSLEMGRTGDDVLVRWGPPQNRTQMSNGRELWSYTKTTVDEREGYYRDETREVKRTFTDKDGKPAQDVVVLLEMPGWPPSNAPAVTATISISAEGASVANQRDITITLKDNNGKAIDYAEVFEIVLFSSSAMTDFVATGGSTGIAAGAAGKIQAIVAKKLFRAISDVTGVCSVIYTDTGTDPGYLAVRLPGGQIIAGGLITNA